MVLFVNTTGAWTIRKLRLSQPGVFLVKSDINPTIYKFKNDFLAAKFGSRARVLETGQKASIHPKSVLYKEPCFASPLIVFYLKLRSSAEFIHDATMVHPLPLIFFGDNYTYNSDKTKTIVSIGSDKLRFKCSTTTNAIIKELRNRLNLVLEYKVSNPGFVNWQKGDKETQVLRAVMELITSEDIGEIDMDAYDDYD